MRIIGGTLRGRTLGVPTGLAVRPTTDRVREASFNVLVHRFSDHPLSGMRALDVFAGSGAMGLEALSRGAAHVTFMDLAPAALAAIRANAAMLRVTDAVTVLAADACHPPPAPAPCTLVFLDPPYDRDVAGEALTALAAAGWLAAGALCTVEARTGASILPPEGFRRLEQRTWGRTSVTWLEKEEERTRA